MLYRKTSNVDKRHVSVARLGFKSYYSYLHSPLWRIIRETVLERDSHKCLAFSCKNDAVQVHHLQYDLFTMVGYTTGTLFSLCRDCHVKCEFGQEGNKLTFHQAKSNTINILFGFGNRPTYTEIGEWYKQKLYGEAQKIERNKIMEKIKEFGEWERFGKFFGTEKKASAWTAPRVDKTELKLLQRWIETTYPNLYTVYGIMEDANGLFLKIHGPSGNSCVWTKQQIIVLYTIYQRISNTPKESKQIRKEQKIEESKKVKSREKRKLVQEHKIKLGVPEPKQRSTKAVKITVLDQTKNLSEWANLCGISRERIRQLYTGKQGKKIRPPIPMEQILLRYENGRKWLEEKK